MDVYARAISKVKGLDKSLGWDRMNGVTTAKAKAEVDGEQEKSGKKLVYNISSSLSFRWNEDLLPALKQLGLQFEAVPFSEWIDQLRGLAAQAATTGKEDGKDKAKHTNGGQVVSSSAADPNQNSALKLIDFFEGSCGGDRAREQGNIVFATDEAEKASSSLRNVEGVIESGLLGKMLNV